MSKPHHLAIVLVKGAQRDFRHHVFGVLCPTAAHLEHTSRFAIRGNTILRELHDLAVIRRHQARWPHEIGLPQALERHLLGIIGVAKKSPEEIESLRTTRNNLTHAWDVRLMMVAQIWTDG